MNGLVNTSTMAVTVHGVWSVEFPTMEGWAKVMQFKENRHLVDSTKSTAVWDRCLLATCGKTVLLLIYGYGVAIVKSQDLKEFTRAYIEPPETDRARATAVSQLTENLSKRFKEQQLYGECGKPFVDKSKSFYMGCSYNSTTIRSYIDHWTAFVRRLDAQDAVLACKTVIEDFIRDVVPLRDVIDPLTRMENLSDEEHKE
ncbi:hypothetical protein PHMEG_00012008 [Phytophthora megakarya]|uniref:Uncharacterized protein n=1 Tax=Phytophthora megakarya TaxID=4795 RepID=A0A225W9U1_9STRA|nr:hypothetical protein PHMEG_00012008 [Phytophthora megakarya]